MATVWVNALAEQIPINHQSDFKSNLTNVEI